MSFLQYRWLHAWNSWSNITMDETSSHENVNDCDRDVDTFLYHYRHIYVPGLDFDVLNDKVSCSK